MSVLPVACSNTFLFSLIWSLKQPILKRLTKPKYRLYEASLRRLGVKTWHLRKNKSHIPHMSEWFVHIDAISLSTNMKWHEPRHGSCHKKHSLRMVELSEQALYYTVYCLPGLSPFHSYEWCLCYVSVYVRPQCRKWDLALIFAHAALVINSSVPSWVPKAITAGLMEHIAQRWVEQRCSWQSLQVSTWVCICCCQWMGCHPASHKVRNTWLLVWLITPATRASAMMEQAPAHRLMSCCKMMVNSQWSILRPWLPNIASRLTHSSGATLCAIGVAVWPPTKQGMESTEKKTMYLTGSQTCMTRNDDEKGLRGVFWARQSRKVRGRDQYICPVSPLQQLAHPFVESTHLHSAQHQAKNRSTKNLLPGPSGGEILELAMRSDEILVLPLCLACSLAQRAFSKGTQSAPDWVACSNPMP